jgi:hypothetical protein
MANLYNITAIILIVIGILFLIYAFWQMWQIHSIKSWPRTTAKVLTAFAEPVNHSKASIDPQNIPIDTNGSYVPKISYEYVVGDRKYLSTSFAYHGKHSYNAQDIKLVMAPLQPGSEIQVLYNPNNYKESYIISGDPNYWNLLIGIVILLVGLFMINKSKKAKMNKQWGTTNYYNTPNLETEKSKSMGTLKFW